MSWPPVWRCALTDDNGSYEVGYGKPPKATRFVKGQRGNPKGRPKGSKNLNTIVDKIGRQRVTVTGNGSSRSISKLEATVIQLTNQAASGDLRAIRELLHLHKLVAESRQVDLPSPLAHERDKMVMDNIVKRIRQVEETESSAAPDAALTEPLE